MILLKEYFVIDGLSFEQFLVALDFVVFGGKETLKWPSLAKTELFAGRHGNQLGIRGGVYEDPTIIDSIL